MASLNKAMIIGRLGADPELRYTQNNTAVANMSVATSERYKDSNGELQETTEWHRVVVWGRIAEICHQYLKKGSLAYFEGPIQTRSWEDKEGHKQYSTEIKALTMQMLDTRTDASSRLVEKQEAAQVNDNAGEGDNGDFDPDSSSGDDLPF